MPRVTGNVIAGGSPAANAYVQLRDKENEFCGETRADDDGHYVLYAVPGQWRLVSWLPNRGETQQDLQVGTGDVEIELRLAD